MSLWDTFKRYAADQARTQLETLRREPIRIALPEAALNRVVEKVVARRDDIERLQLSMHDGYFRAQGIVPHRLGRLHVDASFEIERFQIDRHAQVAVLRQRDALATRAEGWRGRIALAFVNAVLVSLLGRNLLHRGLRGRTGVQIQGEQITIDLAALGATDLLFSALQARAGAYGGLLQELLKLGADQLTEHWSVVNASCAQGALEMEVRLADPAMT